MRFFVDKLRSFAIFVMAFLAAACSDEDSVPTTATLSADTVSGRAKNCAVMLTASQGTGYVASIISDDEWCHFSSKRLVVEGEIGEQGSKSFFIYFDENYTMEQGRKATITVDLSNGHSFALTLVQRWADQTIAFERKWPELPVCYNDTDFTYVSHGDITVGARTKQRNFTLCFDRAKRAALWVAYPLHRNYTVNESGGRTNEWGYDPKLPTNVQPTLFSSYRGNYDRGHQLPSADRLCSYEANAATFYFSNMTPQQAQFNQGLWANLETSVRNEMCSDTLFVVTGCRFDGTRHSSIAASTTDRSGNTCPIPTHYYKLLLRTEKGNTGKKISEITSADDLRAIAIYIPHHYATSNTLQSDWFISVNELEQITGFDFFPMLPDEIEEQVEEQCNRSKWF